MLIRKQLGEHSSPHQQLDAIRSRLTSYLRGKNDVVETSLATFLAGGHLLLEGPPGMGKTSLARGMASAFGGSFRRVQMTSDLLPSDIVGVLRLRPDGSDFEFRKGPIFSNFLLADELNRTGPKTQSALLEAMAEGTVSVDGETHRLADPFFVIATQNSLEFHGVYPLAESQLDRFMALIAVSAPEKKDELEIYQGLQNSSLSASYGIGADSDQPLLRIDEVRELRNIVTKVLVEPTVLEYCLDIVRATRARGDGSAGVSVRGGLQLVAAVRGLAFLRGREYAIPEDVRDLVVPVLSHRLSRPDEEWDLAQKRKAMQEIVERVLPPR